MKRWITSRIWAWRSLLLEEPGTLRARMSALAFAMAADALHIWPRGNHMLIALPNADGSFTATLFLPKRGAVSFASLRTETAIEEFMSRSFPDARAPPDALDPAAMSFSRFRPQR